MTAFQHIDDLPSFSNLQDTLDNLLPEWKQFPQLCINTVKGHDDHQYGVGSLYYDWDKSVNNIAPLRENPLNEADFVELCSIWKDTVFEEIYSVISKRYILGRVRIISNKPKTCMSWHQDDTRRLHYPIKTQDGCMMIIADKVKHLPANQWCLTDTLHHHTAVNGSNELRVHLVACIIEERLP